MLLSQNHYAKIAAVEEKVKTLDPMLAEFFTWHGYEYQNPGGIWPVRSAWKREELVRQFHLTPDVTPQAITETGFYPEMHWKFWISASFFLTHTEPHPALKTYLFRGVPFTELAHVLPPDLERGLGILQQITHADVVVKGQNFWLE